jgi:DNA replication and repair protein RecF
LRKAKANVQLNQVRVQGFRNLSGPNDWFELQLDAGFSVFFGPNGAGKTNLIEAIYYGSTLKSFRTKDVSTLIGHHRPQARVEMRGQIPNFPVPSTLTYAFERGEKTVARRLWMDDKLCRSAQDFVGHLPLVLFTPEDLHLVRGTPAARRNLMDRAAFAHDAGHLKDVQTYEKTLRMRTALLRRTVDVLPIAQRTALLDAYDEGLAEAGARIIERRQKWVAEVEPHVVAYFHRIHDKPGEAWRPSLTYFSKISVHQGSHHAQKGELLNALVSQRTLDLARKTTSRGPHLDDLRFHLGPQLAVEHASQGQTRALVLALKLAQLTLLAEKRQTPPLFLLDDVTSELDPKRSARFFELLPELVGQCLITTTAEHFISANLAAVSTSAPTAYFSVDNGSLVQVD